MASISRRNNGNFLKVFIPIINNIFELKKKKKGPVAEIQMTESDNGKATRKVKNKTKQNKTKKNNSNIIQNIDIESTDIHIALKETKIKIIFL